MSHFTIKSKRKLSEMTVGETLTESDYATLTPDGYWVQMEFNEDENRKPNKYNVKPGIWSIKETPAGFKLDPTDFIHDRILDEFVSTKEITDRVDKFFSRFQVYRDHGFDIPKRGILLYGPPGTGKSVSISKIAHKYGNDGKTAIIIWSTDKLESYAVKDFFATFEYDAAIEKVVLIAEDIGGVEIDQVRMKSDASLLALLDNQEKIFKLPILILATTNFPEIFLGNLMNRPNRFDDKIKVDYPKAEQRLKLLEFFSKADLTNEAKTLIQSDKCKEFSVAHIREVVLRAAIFDYTAEKVIEDIYKEIEHYKNAFEKDKSMGIGGMAEDE